MSQHRFLCIFLVAGLAGCGEGPASSAENTTPSAAGDGSMAVNRAPGKRVRPPRVLSGPRALGAPHTGFIDQVVLSAEGSSALTRDSQGGVRFWATLDGSSQPLPAPLGGAIAMSLARRKNDRWTAALIDTAGAAHFYRIGADGSFAELSATRPSGSLGRPRGGIAKLTQVVMLRGGKHAVALREDRSIELYDVDTATSLARALKRRFRPTQLRIDQTGSAGIAIEVLPGSKETKMALYHLSIDAGAATISIGKRLYSATESVAVTPNHASLSRDGDRFAYLVFDAPKSVWRIVLVDLPAGNARKIDLTIASHMNPSLGFIDRNKLLVNTQPNGQTWEIDTSNSDEVIPRAAPATHLSGVPAHGFGANLHVVGLGTWLYVRDLKKNRAVYLGYDAFEPSWAALSPSGKHVAWATNRGQVYVESVDDDDDAATRIDSDPMTPVWRLAFAGDDRLITANTVGGLTMLDWRNKEVVDEADSGGSIQVVGLSAQGDVLQVIRQSGQTWLFDVSARGLAGPFVIDDGSSRSGLLAGGKDLLWTLDVNNVYRTYTRKDIARGISRKEMLDRGKKIVALHVVMAVDGNGVLYVLEPKGTRTKLSLYRHDSPKKAITTVQIPSSSVFSVVPSPDAARIAVLRDSGILSVFDAKSGKQLWSFSFVQSTSILSWSADGKRIASAGLSGAAVLDAETGTSLRTTCAPWFSIRETAPPATFSNQNAQLCAR